MQEKRRQLLALTVVLVPAAGKSQQPPFIGREDSGKHYDIF
jgi:hypothetical protein